MQLSDNACKNYVDVPIVGCTSMILLVTDIFYFVSIYGLLIGKIGMLVTTGKWGYAYHQVPPDGYWL